MQMICTQNLHDTKLINILGRTDAPNIYENLTKMNSKKILLKYHVI